MFLLYFSGAASLLQILKHLPLYTLMLSGIMLFVRLFGAVRVSCVVYILKVIKKLFKHFRESVNSISSSINAWHTRYPVVKRQL